MFSYLPRERERERDTFIENMKYESESSTENVKYLVVARKVNSCKNVKVKVSAIKTVKTP